MNEVYDLEAMQCRARKATEARMRYNVLEIRQPEILSALHKSQKDVPELLDLVRKQQDAFEQICDELSMADAFARPISAEYVLTAIREATSMDPSSHLE